MRFVSREGSVVNSLYVHYIVHYIFTICLPYVHYMLENNSSEINNYKIHDHRPEHESQAGLNQKLRLTQNDEHNNHSELNVAKCELLIKSY